MESVVGANGWVDRKSRPVVNGRFRVGPMIRFSQFGAVYHGFFLSFENVNAEYPALIHESEVYNRLKGGDGLEWKEDHNALVMDVMGLSLDDFFTCCSKKFSLKTVLMLAEKMINRVEFVHSKSFLHRDIKPENFLFGAIRQPNEVNIVSFSLAKQYRDTSTHQHIPYRLVACFILSVLSLVFNG
ncbi:unnamed protein product [Malus baccata var. baccata]